MSELNNPGINYIDTWTILGHYDFNHNRIEISSFLKQFPELHTFCVTHELKHAEIRKKYGYSWRHYLLDIKDRFKLHNNKILSTQLRSFKEEIKPKHMHALMFMFGYGFISIITSIFNIIEIRHVIPKKDIRCILGFHNFKADHEDLKFMPRYKILVGKCQRKNCIEMEFFFHDLIEKRVFGGHGNNLFSFPYDEELESIKIAESKKEK